MAPIAQLISTNRTLARVGRIEEYIKGACEHLNSLTEDICMHPNEEMRAQGLDRLKDIEADILEVERDIEQFQSAFEATTDSVNHMINNEGSSENDINASDILLQHLNVLKDDIEPIKDTDKFRQFENFIIDFQRKAQSTSEQTSEPSQEDSLSTQQDMVITSADIQTHCPYTGQVMTDPVKNLLCGHVYDRIGIQTLMKNASSACRGAKCPVSMCANNKPILRHHIVSDPILKAKIVAMNLT